MSRFSVGDKVRVNCPQSVVHGAECSIASPPHVVRIREDSKTGEWLYGLWTVYNVDLPTLYAGNLVPFGFTADELIPLDDGRELVSWESCAWKPAGVDA